jgi:hypothetical protein
MMTQSPSSLKLFQTCPRQYKARYIEKLIKFEGNEFTRRGEAIHACMEAEIKHTEAPWPEGEDRVKEFGLKLIRETLNMDETGKSCLVVTEAGLAIGRDGYSVAWNDPNGCLRSRVDLAIIPPAYNIGFIIDWKTGKTAGSYQQLLINALCLVPEYGPRTYEGMFVYLDQQRIEKYTLPVPARLPKINGSAYVDDLRRTLDRLEAAYKNDSFPEQRSPACRWCELKC